MAFLRDATMAKKQFFSVNQCYIYKERTIWIINQDFQCCCCFQSHKDVLLEMQAKILEFSIGTVPEQLRIRYLVHRWLQDRPYRRATILRCSLYEYEIR